jgi:hypothetical protein
VGELRASQFLMELPRWVGTEDGNFHESAPS